MLKQIFILAGANGSGKSTISKELLPTDSRRSYVGNDLETDAYNK